MRLKSPPLAEGRRATRRSRACTSSLRAKARSPWHCSVPYHEGAPAREPLFARKYTPSGEEPAAELVKPSVDASTVPGLVAESQASTEGPSLEEAFRLHARDIGTVCLRITGRPDEVDDLVQEVFLIAFRGLKALSHPAALRSWLTAVAVRCATRRLRLLRVKALLGFDDAPEYLEVAAPGTDPADRVQLAQIYQALDALSSSARVAWVLHHFEGYTLGEVAALGGCSLATAKRRVAAAQRHLEAVLETSGGRR